MTRVDDLEDRLNALEHVLDPTAGTPIVFETWDGHWTVDGEVVDPDRVTPAVVIGPARERTIIDPDTLEIVGTEPITEPPADANADADAGDDTDTDSDSTTDTD